MSKSEEFYEKLYGQLKSTNTWPNFYLFKFIIKSNTNNLELIKTIFQNIDLEINTKSFLLVIDIFGISIILYLRFLYVL